jgi:epoxyqueuosine reductase QueG
MKYINLQEICKELNIYEFGVASWPLPENAKSILYESNPCPFTAANVEERLLGTSLFTPKSAIVCLFPYYVEHKDPSNLSRYTWATDYHLVINEYLKKLIEKLQIINTDAQFSIHCDTSPLADRYMAYLAGLGFYGKNNCFISPKWGSYVVIGTILTTLELEPDTPLTQSCMECNRCITACLGQCLGHDEFKFDTCKSYLTQKKGELTSEEEHIIAKTPLVFGCDVCQEVCPHNKDISTTPIPEFQSVEPYIDIDELDSLTNKEFKAKYGHRAFSWRGKKILMRNQEIIESKKLL